LFVEDFQKAAIAEMNKTEETSMKSLVPDLSKNYVTNKVLFLEQTGFLVAIVICWLTEFLDPPFSFTQVIIETAGIAMLGYLIISTTSNLIKRIKQLEGFAVICAECKQVRIKDQWRPIEELVVPKTDVQFSHSICPVCSKKLYAEFLVES
jgi:hypothetical protein